jgi:hypothetical protein
VEFLTIIVWSTIPPISTKQTIISHLKNVQTVKVNNSSIINKTNNNLSPKVCFVDIGGIVDHHC